MKISFREFAQLIRKLMAACPAVRYGLAHLRDLERAKYKALKGNNNYNRKMEVASYTRNDIEWWCHNLLTSYERIKPPLSYSMEIFSDALKTGSGALAHGDKARGFWFQKEQTTTY